MNKSLRLITNNPRAAEYWRSDERLEIEMLHSDDVREVLYRVRDLLHMGHRLMTHPFSGSLKPNENPYKSILLTGKPVSLDLDHVAIIEQCIQIARDALDRKKIPAYKPPLRMDYMMIDKELIENGIKRAFNE